MVNIGERRLGRWRSPLKLNPFLRKWILMRKFFKKIFCDSFSFLELKKIIWSHKKDNLAKLS